MGKIKHVDDVLSSVFQRTGVMGKSVRNTGSGHFVFEFAGYQHIIGKTPSDWRSEKNTVADICRGVASRCAPGTIGEQLAQKAEKPAKALKTPPVPSQVQSNVLQEKVNRMQIVIDCLEQDKEILETMLNLERNKGWWARFKGVF